MIMGTIKQRTIKQAVTISGISLHGGQRVELRLRPAAPNTGIIFKRTDLYTSIDIPAKAEMVTETTLQTVLTNQSAKIGTVEHLLSAFAGLGIDNAYVDVSASELPIMDGSSAPFIFLIQSAGILEQDAPKRFIKIKKPLKVVVGDKWVSLSPHDGFRIAFTIDFDHPIFKTHDQYCVFDFSCEKYLKEVSRARTFGFVSGLEKLREMGLAKGGGLDNAVGLDDYRILNEGGLRFEDELIKHKILDAIGDLYLLGAPIIGAYEGFKSGHAVNHQLCMALLKDKDAWEYVTFEEHEKSAVSFMALQVLSH